MFSVISGLAAHEDVVMLDNLVKGEGLVQGVIGRGEQMVHLVIGDLTAGGGVRGGSWGRTGRDERVIEEGE